MAISTDAGLLAMLKTYYAKDGLQNLLYRNDPLLKEIKKEIGSNVSDAQTMSKEAAQQMYAELTRGQDVTKPNVTPEMIAGAITGSVSGMDGVDPEALKQFNQALIGLFTIKPTEDEHDGGR